MNHVKATKRRFSKKASSPISNPAVVATTDLSARPLDDVPESSPRPRSHSIAHSPIDKEIPTGRRRAATRCTEPALVEAVPDVFQFLDQDQSEPCPEVKLAAERKHLEQVAASTPENKPRKSSASYSFRSDSGISVRGNSPGRASSTGSGDEYQPPTPPDIAPNNMGWGLTRTFKAKRPGTMAGAYMTDTESILGNPTAPDPKMIDFSSPESFYYGAQHLPTKAISVKKVRPARPSIDMRKVTENTRRQSISLSSPKSARLEKPVSGPRPRIYRKFDALNHRILRHLQEEIIQLEEDINTLDELEAAHQAPPNARNSPRQKMLAAKYHDLQIQDYSVLQYKRTDLLEKIALKTEQYNRTLCSFSKVIQTLPTPSESDIETYENGLVSSPSIIKGDRRILDHKSDLVLVAPSRLQNTSADLNHPNPLYTTIAAICAAILFPLLAFGAISEFFGRMVIVAIIGGMIALWASHSPAGRQGLIEPRDGWKCAVLYFGFMSIAALMIT